MKPQRTRYGDMFDACSAFLRTANTLTDEDHSTATRVAHQLTQAVFAGRKGHGGGECTRRVLRPEQLEALIGYAIASVLTNEAARRALKGGK